MTLLTNIEKKSTLAKLLATENIQVEQNNVQTASFDVANRILTIPIFKHENKDVIDMLIAHECAHALWTGLDDWKSITEESDEYKSYCNVLEDCRIDKMIQKKYPGIVKNYINGYKELIKIDFFGVNNKDVNTLNLIDRINLFYKSSKTADISFADAEWVIDEIDNLKTLDDVKVLAKKLLEQEKAKQESTSDDHGQGQNDDDTKNNNQEHNESESSYVDYDVKDNDDNDDNSDNDTDIQQSEENSETNDGDTESVTEKNDEPDSYNGEKNTLMPKTVSNAQQNTDKVTYNGDQYLKYFSIPDVDLKKAIVSNSVFIQDHRKYYVHSVTKSYSNSQHKKYYDWAKSDFKKFKRDNEKVVNYLVKEFEMKKSATAYKRASTDKTGVLDSLKLKNYKFSDDIFKRLTVLPDEKNHGFIFLLDWSGSMVDCLGSTIDQLTNLIYFAKKINIPFEVYAFSEMNNKYGDGRADKPFIYKNGDLQFDSNIRLINIASHKLKKKDLDESLFYLHMHKNYYVDYYNQRGRYLSNSRYQGYMIQPPEAYYLSSTPLNESLVVLNKLIPLFKNKYSIEKLSLITLTDGHANGRNSYVIGRPMTAKQFSDWRMKIVPVIKDGNKTYSYKKDKKAYGSRHYSSRDYTGLLMTYLKKKHIITVVGFHIVKNSKNYGVGEYVKDSYDKSHTKQLNKGYMTAELKHGYDDFWILNNKKLAVVNDNKIDDIQEDMKPGQIKKLFAGGMKSRLTSRIVLNKFIENVA